MPATHCVHSIKASFKRLLFGLPLLALSIAIAGAQSAAQGLNDYFKRAKELEERQDFSSAQKIYLEAMAAFPQQPEVLKRLGVAYQTELRFQESIETFQRVLSQAPQYPEVNFYLGMSYLGLNLFEKSIEAFKTELTGNPKYRRARYYSGLAYQSLERIPEAIQQFDILVKEDPRDSKALYQLARIHRAASLAAIKQLSHVDPDSVLFNVLRAESYSEDQKYPEAIKEYQQVLAKDPSFPGVHFGLGEIYYKMVNPTGSEREFRLALQEDPNHPMANYYLGELLLRAQKPAEAIPVLRISIGGDPQFVAAYFQLGKCYTLTGQPQEALAMLLKAEQLNPDSKMTHYQLAQVYGRLKDDTKRKHHLALFEKLTRQEKAGVLKKSDTIRTATRKDKAPPVAVSGTSR